MKNKPYRCVYCGRRFSKPTGHRCKGGFRKHHLEFEYTPTEKEREYLEEIAKSFFEEIDNIAPDPEKTAAAASAAFIKSTNRGLESILPKDDEPMPQPTSPLDVQVGGDHYKKYKIQPIEFAMANNLNACQTNILKYIMRYKDKDGKKDLEKARHYIDILIQTEYPNK